MHPLPLTSSEIAAFLPYGPCLLLVDQILECDWESRIVTTHTYHDENPIIRAHFNLVPGFLQQEQACQTAVLLASLLKKENCESGRFLALGEIRAKFSAFAPAPCILRAEVRVEFAAWDAIAFRGQITNADGVMTATLRGIAKWCKAVTASVREAAS